MFYTWCNIALPVIVCPAYFANIDRYLYTIETKTRPKLLYGIYIDSIDGMSLGNVEVSVGIPVRAELDLDFALDAKTIVAVLERRVFVLSERINGAERSGVRVIFQRTDTAGLGDYFRFSILDVAIITVALFRDDLRFRLYANVAHNFDFVAININCSG